MSLPVSLATAIVAIASEAAAGYPAALFRGIGHLVTWMGALLSHLDQRLNLENQSFARRRAMGAVALGILLLAVGVTGVTIQALVTSGLAIVPAAFVLGLLASSCLASRSLDAHVAAVAAALQQGVAEGRIAVGRIVGRDTAALDPAGVARAAIESLAENFADGVVAPAVYLALAGLPGGLLYKAINTADSMIGHRTPRHEAFGFAAAKLDDVVNWPAARLAAFWIVLAAALAPGASAREAWRIMRRDARGHPSPNAGWPEAAMAGALNVRLGGPRAYAGRIVDDAALGDGGIADVAAIDRALRLIRIAGTLNAAAIVAVAAGVLVIARGR